jgi:hypothetical protein
MAGGILSGLGAGLQRAAASWLQMTEEDRQRKRQALLDKAALDNDALNRQKIQEELNDLPRARASSQAGALANALGDEAKFGSKDWLDLMQRAGTPVPTREPNKPYDHISPEGDFSFVEDDSVDPGTHAVLPPEIIQAREGRKLALAKDKAIMNFLNGDANVAAPDGKPSPRMRATAKLALGIDPDQLYGPAGPDPVNIIESVGKPDGPNAGKKVKEGVDRTGKVVWEQPVPDESVDVEPDVQTTSKGRKYLNLGLYTGNDRNGARTAASKAGAIPVTPDQADSLQQVDNARRNQQDVIAQVTKILPKDAQGRITGFVGRNLSQVFQTEPQRAAFGSWRNSAITTLRAAAGSKGLRINQAEILMALANDLPTLNDDAATALQKVANINAQLDNVEESILGNRSGSKASGVTAVAPPGGAQKTATLDDINAFAKAKGLTPKQIADQLKANGYTIIAR